MKASELIKKIQEEMRKYGDMEVILHTPRHLGMPKDVATFSSISGLDGGQDRRIWISTEEAE